MLTAILLSLLSLQQVKVIYLDPSLKDNVTLTSSRGEVVMFADSGGVIRMIVSISSSPSPSPPPVPASASPFTPIIRSFKLDKTVAQQLAANYDAVIQDIEHTRIDNQLDAQNKLIAANRTLLAKYPNLTQLFDSLSAEANKKKIYTLNDLHDLYVQLRLAFNESQ